MIKKVALNCIAVIFSAFILCGCVETENEKTKIQLSALQDVLSWDGGVVWNTEKDVLLKRMKDSSESSIFQDPFYEKEEGENINLQYIEEGQLYYIRTFANQYYELCSMNLDSLNVTVLYTNCSEAERTYNYLGIKNKTVETVDERKDIIKEVVQKFCRIGNDIYLMDDDSLYKMNQWTKYRKIIDDNIDSDTELVFIGFKIYYINADKMLMEYDRKTGIKRCLSDWMVKKLCLCGGALLIQRMNGELYCCNEGEELEKLAITLGRLIQGDEKYFYCLEENDSKLMVYDVNTFHIQKVIKGNNIWGIGGIAANILYYLESEEDYLILRKTGISE